MNKYSKIITEPKSKGAAQSMLYALGQQLLLLFLLKVIITY